MVKTIGRLLLSGWCLLWAPMVYGLEPMNDASMSTVTAREGLALDINLQGSIGKAEFRDANGVSGGAGEGVFRIGDGPSEITLGNGSGNPAALNGLTLDMDGAGNGRMVIGLPTGSLDVEFPGVLIVSQFSTASGQTAFGDLSLTDLNPGGSSVSLIGKGDGLRVNIDGSDPIRFGTLTYTDPDGMSGNAGSISFGNIRLHDTEYTNWHFEGFELDNDYPDGLVFSVDSTGSHDDMGISTELSINSTTLGTLKIGGGDGGINPRGSRLSVGAFGDGFTLTPVVKISNINRVRWMDSDGFGSSSGSDIRSEGVQAGDIFGNASVQAANLGEHTVNVDATEGIVIESPDRSTSITPLDVSIPPPSMGGGAPMLKTDFSNIDWRGTILSVSEGGSNGEGLTLDLRLHLTLNEIRLTDTDGFDGTGSNGFFSIGYRGTGQGIVINNGSGGPADLSGMTVDVSSSEGAVLSVPEGASNFGNVTTVIDKVTLGDASTEIGSFDARNMNFQGSTVRINAH